MDELLKYNNNIKKKNETNKNDKSIQQKYYKLSKK